MGTSCRFTRSLHLGRTAMGVEGYHFEELIENYKLTKGVLLDTDLDENDWDGLIVDFKRTVKEKAKKDFPQDVYQQLLGAISAVFLSWESNRAKVYRKLNQIPAEWGMTMMPSAIASSTPNEDQCACSVAEVISEIKIVVQPSVASFFPSV